MGAMARWLDSQLQAQRGHLVGWAAILMGAGIGTYFSLRSEPPIWMLSLSGLGAIIGLLIARWLPGSGSILLSGIAIMTLGFGLAGTRAHWVAGPVLQGHYYGPVQGRIRIVDRSASDAVRITLDQIQLTPRRAPSPTRLRVSLHGTQGFTALTPGKTVILNAFLSPPRGAAEPGGFDFRRHAWFQRLGAVGYTRSPVLAWSPPSENALLIARLRHDMSQAIRNRLPGPQGAFAAAILTGDRMGVSQDTMEALRRSNLAHLLAISGLHIGLLSGLVFGALRLALVLMPRYGQRWPVKEIAAGGALLAAAAYLLLSGQRVATERAFIMTGTILIAVMLNRRALSLRAVALAALVILSLRPETLTGPGFQMSFAATTALVAAFGWLRDAGRPRLPRPLGAVLTVVISSFVAGSATAPFAMAHFNQFAQMGLIANVAAVPVMGTVVMPAAILAAVLAPFGAEQIGLMIMGQGIEWILTVAHWIGDRPQAVRPVMMPPAIVLPLMTLGALWLVLWRGALRGLGAVPLVLSIWMWGQAQRPDILISQDGALVGVMTPQGRSLSRDKGAGFVAGIWLANDGESADQPTAAAKWPTADQPKIHHIRGKRAVQAFEGCSNGDIVVSNQPLPGDWPCTVFDSLHLSDSGAIAGYRQGAAYSFESDSMLTGHRLWRPDVADQ